MSVAYYIKLRFHLGIMRMRMMNANATTNRAHKISTRVPFMHMQMQQNESLHVVIGANANVLSDGKSLHTHGHHRVAHAVWRKNYTDSLIAYIIRIHRITHKSNLSFSVYMDSNPVAMEICASTSFVMHAPVIAWPVLNANLAVPEGYGILSGPVCAV